MVARRWVFFEESNYLDRFGKTGVIEEQEVSHGNFEGESGDQPWIIGKENFALRV